MKKPERQFLKGFGTVTTSLALIMAILLLLATHQTLLHQSLIVFAAGNPDGYGNAINTMSIYQNEIQVAYATTSNYSSGMTLEIDSSILTRIVATVRLNLTLASSQSDAKDKTRVFLNISDVVSNQNMTFWQSGQDANYYYVSYNSSLWTPDVDTTYNVTLDFDAYY